MEKIFIAFLLGLAGGAGGMYLYLNERQQSQLADIDEANKRFYEEKFLQRQLKQDEDTPTIEEPSPEQEKAQLEELSSKLNYNALYNKEPLTSAQSKDSIIDRIVIISPEQYESESFLSKQTLTYYAGDETLCDELTDEVIDVEDYIGFENLGEFGNRFETDPDIMHVRNNQFACVYEVIRDERSYSAVFEREDG